MAVYPRNGRELEPHLHERLPVKGPSESRCGPSKDRGDEEEDREGRHEESGPPITDDRRPKTVDR